jgi:hypothetical protein
MMEKEPGDRSPRKKLKSGLERRLSRLERNAPQNLDVDTMPMRELVRRIAFLIARAKHNGEEHPFPELLSRSGE